MTTCARDIRNQFPELSEEEIDDLILAFGEHEGSMSKNFATWTKEDFEFHRANRARQKVHFNNTNRNIRNTVGSRDPDVDSLEKFENLLAKTVGHLWKGFRLLKDRKLNHHKNADSTANNMLARKGIRFGRMMVRWGEETGLTPQDFDRMTKDPIFGDALVRELFEMGSSGNEIANKLAKIIKEFKKLQVDEANSFGAGIRWLDDHLTVQWHNPVEMLGSSPQGRLQAKADWIDTIMPLLDENRMRRKVTKKYLSQVYDAFTKGKTEFEMHHAVSEKSLSERMGISRELHFKNADAWMLYNKRYGHPDPVGSIFKGMDVLDERLALMQDWGPDPDGLFNSIYKEIEADLTPFQRDRLLASWKQINGEATIVGNPTLARAVTALTSFHIITKLPKAVISAFADVGIGNAVLDSHGMGFFGAYKNTFNMLKHRFDISDATRQAELKHIVHQLGIGFDSLISSAVNRWVDLGSVPGMASTMADNFFKINGLNAWTDLWREAFSMVASNNFAAKLKKGWDDLDPDFKKRMEEYGFTSEDWAELRNNKATFNMKDRFGADPDYKNVELSTDEYITGDDVFQKTGNKELSEKVSRFFVAESRHLVPEAGASHRAFMQRQSNRGTIVGSTLQMLYTFRSLSVKMAMDIYARGGSMGVKKIALHGLIPMIGLGYASLSVKKLIQGKEPLDPTDLETFFASWTQSGVGGIMADIMMENMQAMDTSWDETLLGVHYELFKDLTQISAGLIQDDIRAKDVLQKMRGNTPYVGLPVVEHLYNYAFYYPMLETYNPGHLERMESFASGLGGTPYMDWAKPSNFVPFGGGS